MTLRIGDTAPDFLALSTEGPIQFHRWMESSWVVLLSHPGDFTPVCTTELGTLAKLMPEFRRRRVKVVGLSVDTAQSHAQWARDIAAIHSVTLNFPIIADPEKIVSHLYGMIHCSTDETHTVRTVFVVDPAKKIRAFYAYPQSAGRNFREILRLIDSLQLTDRHNLSTPAEWQPGEEALIPTSISEREAKALFPGGWRSPRPYLRFVTLPRLN